MPNALYAKFKFFAIHREYIAKIINAEIKNKRQWSDLMKLTRQSFLVFSSGLFQLSRV